jgi:hypothetical protein
MKIQIVKKATNNKKVTALCSSWIDEPPMNKK